jgi:hypothetical protein
MVRAFDTLFLVLALPVKDINWKAHHLDERVIDACEVLVQCAVIVVKDNVWHGPFSAEDLAKHVLNQVIQMTCGKDRETVSYHCLRHGFRAKEGCACDNNSTRTNNNLFIMGLAAAKQRAYFPISRRVFGCGTGWVCCVGWHIKLLDFLGGGFSGKGVLRICDTGACHVCPKLKHCLIALLVVRLEEAMVGI